MRCCHAEYLQMTEQVEKGDLIKNLEWKFTLASNKGQDFYDVSLVDGFNLPVSVTPQGGLKGCNRTSCPSDVNTVRPPNFVVEGSDGSVIACKSARLAFDQPEYCCIRPFAFADKCPPTPFQ
ncbi:hypothetical protein VNO78_09935 [Psophocarpus tetragonolobus]|uniref:Thaumatin-like protein n=1 Tax=Psophocarpus tetragonolobus TaxID=3891 RepID=A0AAN9SJY1_PSOTE